MVVIQDSLPEWPEFPEFRRRLDYVEETLAKQGGSVDGGDIDSGIVDYVRLLLGSFDNLIVNPDFDVNGTFVNDTTLQADPNFYGSGAGGLWQSESVFHSGQRAARYDVNSQTTTAYLGLNAKWSQVAGNVRAVKDDTFYVEGFARYADTVPTAQPILAMSFRDKDGVNVGVTSNAWPTLTTGYTKASVTATAPANTAYVAFYVYMQPTNGATVAMLFDSFYARRVIDDSIVENLSADSVTAGTLTIDRLHVGSNDNLIFNPGMEAEVYGSGDPHNYSVTGGGSWSLSSSTYRSGARSARHSATGQTGSDYIFLNGTWSVPQVHQAATDGDVIYLRGYARGSLSSPTIQPTINIRFCDETGLNLGTTTVAWTISGTTWQMADATATAPAGTAYVAFYTTIATGGASGEALLFDDFYARRLIGPGLLEDNTVNTAEIVAGAVTNTEINDVDGGKVDAGTVADARLEPTIGTKTFVGTTGTSFQYGASATSGIAYGSSVVNIKVGGNTQLSVGQTNVSAPNNIIPDQTNQYDLGSSTLLWDDVYATNGTIITTSDPSKKNFMEPTDLGTDFIKALKPVRWKWKDTKDTQAIAVVHAQIDALILEQEAALGTFDEEGKRTYPVETLESKMIERNISALKNSIPTLRRPGNRWHHGFDIENFGHNDSGFIVGEPGNLGFRKGDLMAPVVKALQEVLDRLDAGGL